MGMALSNISNITQKMFQNHLEYCMSICSNEKMALTRDQTNLTKVYHSRLKAKNISYYNNGAYHKVNYEYLMGYGIDYTNIYEGKRPLKEDNSMILSDFNGRVVLSDAYVQAIYDVTNIAPDANGRGPNFSLDKIPEIIAKITSQPVDDIRNVINNKKISDKSYTGNVHNSKTGEDTGKQTERDNTTQVSDNLKKVVDFYYPIFAAAAANGWTKEYNKEIKTNEDYINSAINSGTLQLAKVNEEGNYDPDTNATYFITASTTGLESIQNAELREEIKAWYDAEVAVIQEKEDDLDTQMHEISSMIEISKMSQQSFAKFIQDNMKSFNWGTIA